MFQQPLKASRNPRRRVSQVANVLPPVKGWVSDDSAGLDTRATARILRNLIPTRNSMIARNGCQKVAQCPGPVESLLSFNSGATRVMLAATPSAVFAINPSFDPEDVTATELATELQSGRWQSVSVANAADEIALLMVNGMDGVWRYTIADGLAKITPGNPAANTLFNSFVNITTHKGRVWFLETNSPTVYYSAPFTNNPTAVAPLYLGPLLKLGGHIVAVQSWSRDGGDGPDDLLVFVSNNGEILIYSGIDPAVDFQIVGNFKQARPLGLRCLRKAGADVVYYSFFGPSSLSELLPMIESQARNVIPMRDEFERWVDQNHSSFGWDLEMYSRRSWIVYNVPITPPTKFNQYVLSLDTGAWFEITDWNALCWKEHGENLYFGDFTGAINLADFGQNDNGQAIQLDYMASWSDFGTPSSKKFNVAEVTVRSNAVPKISMDMMLDYRETLPETAPAFASQAINSPWNISPWNISPWSGSARYYSEWQGLRGVGYAGALRYRASIKDSTHELFGYRVVYEEGDVL
jgi:hypothetical protein